MKYAVMIMGLVLILAAFSSAQTIDGELTLAKAGGTGSSDGISGRLCFAEGGERVDPTTFDIGGVVLLGCIDVASMGSSCDVFLDLYDDPIVETGEATFNIKAQGSFTLPIFLIPSDITFRLEKTNVNDCALSKLSYTDTTTLNGVTGECFEEYCEITIDRSYFISSDPVESWVLGFQDTGIRLHMKTLSAHAASKACSLDLVAYYNYGVCPACDTATFTVTDVISLLCPTCKTKNIPYALYQVTSQSQSDSERSATIEAAEASVAKLQSYCDDGACESGTRQAQLLDIANIYIGTALHLVADGKLEQAELYAIQARIAALDGVKVICTKLGNPPGCYGGPVSTEL